LTQSERDSAWNDLASPDAARARRLVNRLSREPDLAMALLEEHFKAPVPPMGLDAQALVRDLDSSRFAVREEASRRLREMGSKAETALRLALKGATPEMKQRIEPLLNALDPMPRLPLTGEVLRGVRAIEVMERIGTPAAGRLLQSWREQVISARLALEARLALDRLAPDRPSGLDERR